jgi:predicted O-methyltransferase YrrM
MRAYLGGHRGAERAGLHVVRASYDSPIPRPEDLAGTFERRSAMRGIEWDPEAQTVFLEQELAPYIAEFSPTEDPASQGEFRLGNQTYDRVDAELLYGIVRWAGPARYVELGSGYSTLVASEALARNGRGELACYDPYPSGHVMARADLRSAVRPISAQQLDESVLQELSAGDVLFVDTTHTVKQGGDVNRIVLDLLPILKPGVLVHFHDIFLPRDYSAGHIARAHYWTEQYLLQAFLSGNPGWEVLIGGQAVVLHAPERVAAVIPSYRRGVSPGAFWIRRRS